jgi:replicative DNA helicase
VPLLSTTRRATTLSPPLPVPNDLFTRNGLAFRRGQFSILAAAPTVGKSLTAENIALATKVPVLFFSADSDEWTVKQRACSILTGTLLTDVDKYLNSGNDADESYFAEKLSAADHIDFCYQTDIDPEFIVLRMQAYAELRGDYPELIVVDNMGNGVVDQDNESSELRAMCRELQRIARSTKAHVLGLAHVTGQKENGDQPIGLSDLLYKIGKIPEMVLGMHRSGENTVTVTVPKQRGGKTGGSFEMPMHYPTATLGGFRHV